MFSGHANGPLAEERNTFLKHLASRGTHRSTLLRYTRQLRVIAVLMDRHLGLVEQAFRQIKTVQLEARPAYHKLDRRIRTHVFLCINVPWDGRCPEPPCASHGAPVADTPPTV